MPPEIAVTNQGGSRTAQGIKARRLSYAARQRAYRRLAQAHPEEFHTLHDEEKRKDGIAPLRRGRPRVEAQ